MRIIWIFRIGWSLFRTRRKAVSYPELRGCLTSGETAEAALKNAQDCKREWLAAALEDGYEIPEPAPDVKYTNH